MNTRIVLYSYSVIKYNIVIVVVIIIMVTMFNRKLEQQIVHLKDGQK